MVLIIKWIHNKNSNYFVKEKKKKKFKYNLKEI